MKSTTHDEQLMTEALEEAKKAFTAQEVPIGAVIVDAQGAIVARGYNQIEGQRCQTAHAEMLAIKAATQHIGNWRLEGCTLYVTLEPCLMCYAAIRLSRITRVVFGADSPLFGYRKDQDCFVMPVKRVIEVTGGVKAAECGELLQTFFNQQRSQSS